MLPGNILFVCKKSTNSGFSGGIFEIVYDLELIKFNYLFYLDVVVI